MATLTERIGKQIDAKHETFILLSSDYSYPGIHGSK